ncbi:bacterial transcriptional activator domain-containing protein [Actinoplanes sp. N902-109]|uniref:AfsR/SARP family transcriptional regulator n=1 Tax=Actinoplanes sp. (strain N902-109) TaxID=649831 RepID=UPI0003AAE64D|nr:bacterial transcriptional activator domain-containing protein [Actinoplanes sp. N902-109]
MDVDHFEERAAQARTEERAGHTEAAVAAYEDLLGRYRGEFVVDGPYEEWAAPRRERLRLQHLDALDRLAQLHLDAGRCARAADLAQRLLAEDPCREHAHRLLMRCHSRRGLPHLALLQFRSCVRTLNRELRVEPAPETVALFRAIRRHDQV